MIPRITVIAMLTLMASFTVFAQPAGRPAIDRLKNRLPSMHGSLKVDELLKIGFENRHVLSDSDKYLLMSISIQRYFFHPLRCPKQRKYLIRWAWQML